MNRLLLVFKLWLCIVGLLGVSACAQSPEEKAREGLVSASVMGYNHTPLYIHRFYLEYEGHEGGSGNAQPYGNGGEACCLSYLRKWQPDMWVSVRWSTSNPDPKARDDQIDKKWHHEEVRIEKYDEPGAVHVHFLPENKVRVVISNMTARHPEYQGPSYPVAPPEFKFKF